jgi:hypothetical protein
MASRAGETRESLEKRLDKLRANLKYWRTWEVEYEACKEEIDELDEITAEQMVLQRHLVSQSDDYRWRLERSTAAKF